MNEVVARLPGKTWKINPGKATNPSVTNMGVAERNHLGAGGQRGTFVFRGSKKSLREGNGLGPSPGTRGHGGGGRHMSV